jgi:hypothetical protein
MRFINLDELGEIIDAEAREGRCSVLSEGFLSPTASKHLRNRLSVQMCLASIPGLDGVKCDAIPALAPVALPGADSNAKQKKPRGRWGRGDWSHCATSPGRSP